MAFDFLLDEVTGDLVINPDKFDLTLVETEQDSFKQRLGIRLNTNRTEWVFDTTYGVPYTEEIISQKITQDEIDAILQAEALREEDVNSILDFNSEYDRFNRCFSAEFKVISPEGTIDVLIPNDVSREWKYPEASDSEFSIECDLFSLIQSSNGIYFHVNFETPFEGNSPWSDVTMFIESTDELYQIVNNEIPDGGTTPWQ